MGLQAFAIASASSIFPSQSAHPQAIVHSSTAASLCSNVAPGVRAVLFPSGKAPHPLEVEVFWSDDTDLWIEEGEVGLNEDLGVGEVGVTWYVDIAPARSMHVEISFISASAISDPGLSSLVQSVQSDVHRALVERKFVIVNTPFSLRLRLGECEAVVREAQCDPPSDSAHGSIAVETNSRTAVTIAPPKTEAMPDAAVMKTDEFSEKLSEFLYNALTQRHMYTSLGVPAPRAVLLEGIAGSAKTEIVRSATSRLRTPLFSFDLTPLLPSLRRSAVEEDGEEDEGSSGNSVFSDLERRCDSVFERAMLLYPSVVLVKGIDGIRGGSMIAHQVARLFERWISRIRNCGVLVVATTRDASLLPSSFKRNGAFATTISVPIPIRSKRHKIICDLIRTMPLVHSEVENPETLFSVFAEEVTAMTPGFAVGHLRRLVNDAGYLAVKRWMKQGRNENLELCIEDFRVASAQTTLASGVPIEEDGPGVLWEDVLGYEAGKQKVLQFVEWPVTRPEAFSRLGIEAPSGILLHGPTGCGKTLICNALASVARMNFKAINGRVSQVFSQYLGESERIIREVFAQARRLSPCILFIDELDSIATKRDLADPATSTSVPHRVLSTLLNELDGVGRVKARGDDGLAFMDPSAARPHVLLIAATTNLDLVDDALLRPGRIDRLMKICPPCDDDLATIFAGTMSRMQNVGAPEALVDSTSPGQSTPIAVADFTKWVPWMNGLTAADMTMVLREAILDSIISSGYGENKGGIGVNMTVDNLRK
ncbi:AAA-domain-containing protein, partial [Gonapodya prolifera JEL478]